MPRDNYNAIWVKPYHSLREEERVYSFPTETELVEGGLEPVADEEGTFTAREAESRGLDPDKLVCYYRPADHLLCLMISTEDDCFRLSGALVDIRREANLEMLRTMAGLATVPSEEEALQIIAWWAEHELRPASVDERGLIWSANAEELSGSEYLMVGYRYSMSWANLAAGAVAFLDSIQHGHGYEDTEH